LNIDFNLVPLIGAPETVGVIGGPKNPLIEELFSSHLASREIFLL